jgi:hypothetical protein
MDDRLVPYIPDDHPHRVTNTRCRIDTVISPDDGHIVARNVQRIEINIERRDCAKSWFYLRKTKITPVSNNFNSKFMYFENTLRDYIFKNIRKNSYQCVRGFGGLEDAFWPLVPKFAGSNRAETVGFFRAKKSPACLPSEGK